MFIAFFRVFLLLGALCVTQSVHIIGIPSIGVSHGRVLAKIGRELTNRGHRYTLVIPKWEEEDFENSGSKLEYQVRSFDTRFKREDLEFVMRKEMDGEIDINSGIELWQGICEDLLKSSNYFKSLGVVDFMLCDVAALCCPIVADLLNIQRVDISPAGFIDPFLSFIHNFPSPPSYVPQLWFGLPKQLLLLGRIKNTLLYVAGYALLRFYVIPPYDNLWAKYVKDSEFKNLYEVIRSTGILLIPCDFALEPPRPVAAHVKVIGAILPEPPGPLSPYFQDIISSKSDSNLVVVSFGTVVSNFSLDFIEVMASALSRIPALVIWKHKGRLPSRIGNNTKIFPWIPQNNLLGHSQTKLFLTHGGLNSIQEGSYHGIPMVVLPLFADQFSNAMKVKEAGIGETLEIKNLTVKAITEAITKVLTTKSYEDNVVRVSRKMQHSGSTAMKLAGRTCAHSLSHTPTQQAADWVEYGLYNNAGLHFRSEAADNLSLFEVYIIDVMLIIVVVFCICSVCAFYAVRLTINVCRACKKKSKCD